MSYKGWFYICVYMSYTGFGVIHLKIANLNLRVIIVVTLIKLFGKKNPVKLITGFG